MKPDPNARWWDENGDWFMSNLDAEVRQLAEEWAGTNLPPSSRWLVFNRLVFGACKRALKKTDKLLKSSMGGAKAAKGKKDAADARWRNEGRRIALNAQANSERKLTDSALIDEIKLRWSGKAGALPRSDRAIRNLILEMRRAGKLSLEE